MPKKELDEFDNPATRAARYQEAQEAAAEPEIEIPPFRPDDVAARADAAVDLAVARGDFDNLAYAGKPLSNLGTTLDPDWWVQGLIQRENLTGIGPPAIMLRKEDAELDGVLDKLSAERAVRDALEEFNARVVEARRQLLGGPPVVTKLRDVDQEIQRWRARRSGRAMPSSAEQPKKSPGFWRGLFRAKTP
ncbi:DnaJ family domain-containing protein [Renibacterium salmoninarum]|nr:DnaJ family domain-containing protein [Renibacterium salmoninarum]